MTDKAERRNIYNAAILIMRGRDWTLEAQAFIAHSHDEARGLSLVWAKQKHPGADRYCAHTCVITDAETIAELMGGLYEQLAADKADLEKEIEEVRRQASGEPEPSSIFISPETDQLQ
jgi:hypothetical protein